MFLFAILCNPLTQAEGVKVLGSPRQDAVLLRWAPMSPAVWRLGNEYGYIVERFTVLRDGEIPDSIPGVLLHKEPLRPMEQSAWEAHMDADKYVAIAAECLFSSTFKGLDAGGNPHMVYKMYKEEQHRFSFALYSADQSMTAARLSGLYLADETAQQNEKYIYRVYINCPDSMAVDTGFVFTGLSEYQPLPKPQTPEAQWEDKKVSLSWNTLYLNHIYNSYVLERSEGRGDSFKRLSENALVQMSDEGVRSDYMYRTDSLANNSLVYYYRVRGVSAFGELGPPSDSIFGNGRLPLTHAPVFIDKKVVDNERVELTWEYPDEMNPFVTGFKVYRSPEPKSRKEVIYEGVEPAQRIFVDAAPDMTNYYLVSVYNGEEEKVSLIENYAARVDSFPPLAPQGLIGLVDSLGNVRISWLPNKESDLEGYRVYISNHPEHEFILRTPSASPDTVFSDFINIHTLTRNVFYKVAAIDVRQNQSALSEVLVLERPDVIPPVAPRLVSATEHKNGVTLEWMPSSSVDVALHHVYRKGDRDMSFVRVASLPDVEELMHFSDPLVMSGTGYAYYVMAEDEGGLLSPASNHRFVRVVADAPEAIRLRFTKRIDHIVLEWDINAVKSVERVVVYRSEDEGTMRLYGNSEDDQFIDQKLSPGKVYTYRVNAVYEDGSSSPVSAPVKVKL
jgi:uncharacterized protein